MVLKKREAYRIALDGFEIRNKIADVPAKTDLSDHLSKMLKKCGFSFVGSTICYAFMLASGLVNDHIETCFLGEAGH
jgi:DNA-3-methyladenine glycosylase I